MKKSISQQLIEYLQQNSGRHASGKLQEMIWINNRGTKTTPSTITRVLRKLAETGKIYVEQVNGHAHYRSDPPPPKKKQVVVVKDGIAYVSYVTEEVKEEITLPKGW